MQVPTHSRNQSQDGCAYPNDELLDLYTEGFCAVANAQIDVFADVAAAFAALVRKGAAPKQRVVDLLQTIAVQNSLSFLYGDDCLQEIMSAVFSDARVAP
jgi:hypothetical protein